FRFRPERRERRLDAPAAAGEHRESRCQAPCHRETEPRTSSAKQVPDTRLAKSVSDTIFPEKVSDTILSGKVAGTFLGGSGARHRFRGGRGDHAAVLTFPARSSSPGAAGNPVTWRISSSARVALLRWAST